MKTLIALVLLTLSFNVFGNELRKRYSSVVPIQINSLNNTSGSGVIYNKRLHQDGSFIYTVLTAKHVTARAIDNNIWVDNNRVVYLATHKTKDMAILVFKSKEEYSPTPIASKMPPIETKCRLYGYPMGLELYFSEGLYLGPSERNEFHKANVQSVAGMSGGPLICNNQVVGILFGGYVGPKRQTIPFLTLITPLAGEIK